MTGHKSVWDISRTSTTPAQIVLTVHYIYLYTPHVRCHYGAHVVVLSSQLLLSHSTSARHQAPIGAASHAGSHTQSEGQSPAPVMHSRHVEVFGLVWASPLLTQHTLSSQVET